MRRLTSCELANSLRVVPDGLGFTAIDPAAVRWRWSGHRFDGGRWPGRSRYLVSIDNSRGDPVISFHLGLSGLSADTGRPRMMAVEDLDAARVGRLG